jgi:hypothetical protein
MTRLPLLQGKYSAYQCRKGRTGIWLSQQTQLAELATTAYLDLMARKRFSSHS